MIKKSKAGHMFLLRLLIKDNHPWCENSTASSISRRLAPNGKKKEISTIYCQMVSEATKPQDLIMGQE